MPEQDIREFLSYDPPTPEQVNKLETVFNGAVIFAVVVEQTVPEGSERDSILTQIRDSMRRAHSEILGNAS